MFETWLISHVAKLMDQPKWFLNYRDVKLGNEVLSIKNEGTMLNTYQYGMVHEIESSRGGLIGKIVVKYRDSRKNVDCFTIHAVRELVLINSLDK